MSELPQTLGRLHDVLSHIMPPHDARYMIARRTGLTWADILAHPDIKIDSNALSLLESDWAALQAGTPLSRIYGVREFWGRDFALSSETLDPRPDTEILIETALKGAPPVRILDLGTGSGCILITLLKECPDSTGIGVDLSFDAVKTAQKNAQTHGVEARTAFICGHWGESLDESFDLIVSNPPYIANQVIPNLDENVRRYDPILALDGGDDGLKAYREIFLQLPRLLKKGGRAVFEIGFDQGETVMRLGEESGFSNGVLIRDSARLPRVLEFLNSPFGDK